jgi:hypothetical protein
MGKRLHGHDFYEDEFDTLENYGLKKGKVARITKSIKKKGVIRKMPTQENLEELSRKELISLAHQNGIEASIRTSKKELIDELKKVV